MSSDSEPESAPEEQVQQRTSSRRVRKQVKRFDPVSEKRYALIKKKEVWSRNDSTVFILFHSSVHSSLVVDLLSLLLFLLISFRARSSEW